MTGGRAVAVRGMALVAVLWMLAALSGAALGLSAWVRGEARQSQADVVRLQALAAAQSALVHVLAIESETGASPSARRRWQGSIQDLPVQVDWTSAYAAIDINRAPQDLLQAAFRHGVGLPADLAARWAGAIVRARDDPALAGRSAYDGVEDLLSRAGLPFAVWIAAQAFFTVDSDDAAVDPQAVDDELLIVLAQGDAARAAAYARARSTGAPWDLSAIPGAWIRQAPGDRWRVVARVQADGGTLEVVWVVAPNPSAGDGYPWRLLRQAVRWIPSG
ncbi:MAG: hypothetical protein P3W95_004590 [Tepidimonas taiwanensis]|nr:hypothetical protein [Tepidimonas taiwanensis]